tara:strand:+ start:153 stop:746 length:594 start_codon:yes stop_codon:yes gene_type:complete
MNTTQVTLDSEKDLLKSLSSIAIENSSFGYILGIIGNLSRVAFKCPGQSTPRYLEGNLEIINLNGTISPEKCHLHISVSDENCKVWGGHLEEGTLILKEANILIGFIEAIKSTKQSTLYNNRVIDIYLLHNCPWSKRALNLLSKYNIKHKIHYITNDDQFYKIYKLTSVKTFPQCFFNSKFIGGYDSLVKLLELNNR